MPILVGYSAEFIRSYNKLETALQEEVRQKISLFRNRDNHKSLNVHKLHGRMRDKYGFSVNYKYRIVFKYSDKKDVILMDVGDHDIYQ